MFKLDKYSEVPLYRQLADTIAEKIISGEIPPACKLPTIRALSKQLQINNTTIVAAYKFLEQKRVVYAIRGSGTFAAKISKPIDEVKPQLQITHNFNDMTPDTAYFPTDKLRHAFDTVLMRDGAKAFDRPCWGGCESLKESLCEFLKTAHVSASPQNIQILNTMYQGVEMTAEAIINHGDTVLVESPSSQEARAIFTSYGARIIEVPIVNGTLDLCRFEDLAKKYQPKLFFLTPTYQNPTGMCYNDKVQEIVLGLAEVLNAYVLEADHLSDLYYGTLDTRPFPLKARDNNDRVIYVKSFDKVLSSGMPSFMCFPTALSSRFSDAEQAPGYIQRGFDWYIRSGGFAEHLLFLRKQYLRRYHKMQLAVETYLSPFASYIIPDGGLSFWITPHIFQDFSGKFLHRKILVTPGKIFTGGYDSSFRISFANMPEEKISEGIGVIASIWGSMDYE